MNPLVKEVIASLIRKGLTALSAVLITHHIITTTQGEGLVSMALNYLIDLVPLLASALWSYLTTRSARLKMLTALTLEPGSTENDVKAQIANKDIPDPPVTTQPTVAPTTVGGTRFIKKDDVPKE